MKRALAGPRRVGIAGLVALVLLGMLVVYISTASFGQRTYVALLSQTAGLRVGETVEVAGVDVGKVRHAVLEGKHVRISFTLDRSVSLGSQSTASVKVATLLGTHYLDVHPAGPGRLDHATIPLSRTSVPYNLQDVIDKGTDQLQQLDTASLAQALSVVTDTLRASGKEVGPALRGVTRLSNVVLNRSQEYDALFAATRGVSDQLAGSAQELITLMKTSSAFISELTTRRNVIHRLLVEVQSLADAVGGIVDDNKAKIGPLLADLHTVLGVLQAREQDLTDAVHTVSVASRYLGNATGNGPWVDGYAPGGLPDSLYCLTNRC